ncbi:MAG: DUF1330 domain-containing protein [Henriciella sp.]|nr:DUF1330 domain-containing protein [Henriciella sp.]
MKGFIAGAVLGLSGGIGIAACVGLEPQTASSQQVASETPAYMIVLGEVFDRPAFMEGYAAKLPPLYDEFGGHYIAIGGGPGIEVLEGDYSPPSYVVSKWPNAQAARDFWNSEGYDVLRRARIDNSWGDFDVLLVTGLPEPDTAE